MWVSRNGSDIIRSNSNRCDDKMLLQSGAHQLSIGVWGPAAAEQPTGRWTPWAPRRSSGRLSLEDQKETVAVFTYSSQDEILVRRCDGGLKRKPYHWWTGSGWTGCSPDWLGSSGRRWTRLRCSPTRKACFVVHLPLIILIIIIWNPARSDFNSWISFILLAKLRQKAFSTGCMFKNPGRRWSSNTGSCC